MGINLGLWLGWAIFFHNPKERRTKELVPGARTRTFWGDNILLSLVEVDPNSEVPNTPTPTNRRG